jgi:hypothetical protein
VGVLAILQCELGKLTDRVQQDVRADLEADNLISTHYTIHPASADRSEGYFI